MPGNRQLGGPTVSMCLVDGIIFADGHVTCRHCGRTTVLVKCLSCTVHPATHVLEDTMARYREPRCEVCPVPPEGQLKDQHPEGGIPTYERNQEVMTWKN